MGYKFDQNDADDDYGLDDENRDQKRYRRNKRSGGKHFRDTWEARNSRYDEDYD